ncbi:alpha/beta hydrolase [Mycolicibacterium conceptionense]|uniref:alpha/beta fold hydrolase n=1 Tax=Mycolicibacterium conceptionense TaxID=451644 RepID=UPI0032048748
MTSIAPAILPGPSPSHPTRQPAISKRQVLTNDGVEIIVNDSRPVDPVEHTVIMLHGLCLRARSWHHTGNTLRRLKGIRVISYDHRGHGHHSRSAPRHTFTLAQLAQDLADILTDLEVSGPTTITGHSLGGMTALSYLARPIHQQPVRPCGLILVATAAGGLTEYGLGRLLRAPGVDSMISVLDHTPHAVTERAIRVLAQPFCDVVTHDKKVSSGLATAFRQTPMATTLGFLRSLKTFDQRAILPSITAATTVISGAQDILTPPALSEHMAATIPGATHLHLPHAGHMLLQDAARSVTDAVLRTIDRTSSIETPA